MTYVDGFVIPVPKRNLQVYLRLARKVAKVWREHGARSWRDVAICINGRTAAAGPGTF